MPRSYTTKKFYPSVISFSSRWQTHGEYKETPQWFRLTWVAGGHSALAAKTCASLDVPIALGDYLHRFRASVKYSRIQVTLWSMQTVLHKRQGRNHLPVQKQEPYSVSNAHKAAGEEERGNHWLLSALSQLLGWKQSPFSNIMRPNAFQHHLQLRSIPSPIQPCPPAPLLTGAWQTCRSLNVARAEHQDAACSPSTPQNEHG